MVTSTDSFTGIDPASLPAPQVVEELSFDVLRDTGLDDLITLAQQRGIDLAPVRPGDLLMLVIEMFAYRELLLRQRVNAAARSVMPAFATGADLDQIASRRALARRVIAPANPQTGTPAVMESDTDLRARILRAPEGWSVAGPSGAYIAHALAADPRVAFASVTSPQPGEVVLTVQARKSNPAASGAAPADLLATVAAYVGADTRRPLTDLLTVQSAEPVPVAITATITTLPDVVPATPLADARARLDAWLAQTCYLGRDLTRSGLFRALHAEGVAGVTLTSPANDVAIAPHQVAHVTEITITHGGVAQ